MAKCEGVALAVGAGDAKWLGEIAEEADGRGLVGRLGVVKFPSLSGTLYQSKQCA